jgi:regulator of cell morphogenesis and NO signaling
MRYEHDQHGLALAELRAAAHDLAFPEDACTTWRACYRGLEQLIGDLMEHINLENNVLFPRAIEQA